jgi:hypothetical protein
VAPPHIPFKPTLLDFDLPSLGSGEGPSFIFPVSSSISIDSFLDYAPLPESSFDDDGRKLMRKSKSAFIGDDWDDIFGN